MIESFVPFRNLPQELREYVWKLAVRPEKPGVQIFNLSGHFSEAQHDLDTFQSPWPTYYRLSVPPAAAFRSRGNPSTYLVDAGLWTACRESRRVITRELWDEEDLQAPEGASSLDSMPIQLRISSPPCSQRQNSKTCAVTICPRRDLFVLHLDGVSTELLERQPSEGDTAGGWGYWNLKTPHVGWEYNPVWALKLDESLGTNVLTLLGSYAVYAVKHAGLRTMWFINYNIKRKKWVPSREEASRPAGQVFEMGNRRFVEVDLPDGSHHDLCPSRLSWCEETQAESPPPPGKDFLSFIHLIEYLIFLVSGHSKVPGSCRSIKVGVLACEDL